MISNQGDRNDIEDGQDPLEAVTTNGSDGGRDTGFGFTISDVQFPLILVAATSFVLMLAVVTWEGGMKSYGYALSVPILSIILSVGYIALTVFKQNLYAQHGKNMTHLLFMWNFTGACFITFSSPFTTTGNGYFAAWGCVVTSAMAMGFTGDAFRSKVEGMGALLGLAASSAVVVIALIDFVGKESQSYSRKESIYAMVVSIFTILLVIGIMYYQKLHGDQKWFVRFKFGALMLFNLMWLVLACLVTFNGPFSTTGNGYFASWMGASCIAFASFSAWKELDIKPEDVVGFLTPGSKGDTGLSATIT